jgi:ParB family chromosome partitioning protein
MSEKRRGLGRGLGALIPSGNEQEVRPVDVFFPGVQDEATGGGPGARAALATSDRDLGSLDGVIAGEDLTKEDQLAGAVDAMEREWEDSTTGVGLDLLPVPGAHFAEVEITDVRPNPKQPRATFDEEALAELTASIREVGVLQPVVLRPLTPPENGIHFELIMGERRWRACEQAGMTTIPAIVRETADSDLLRDALLENLHRSDLNPLEEAAAYQQLLDDFGCTHDELARRIHRSRPQITNTLRLLRLPPLVQRRVAAGVLSAGHARALLGLPDGAAMERLAQRIVAEGLSVRATEEIVTLGGEPEKPTRARGPRPGEHIQALDDLATRLSDRLDTRVKVNLGKTKGRLTVEFASVQDLNRILETLAPEDPGLLR